MIYKLDLNKVIEYSLYILIFSLPISKSMVEICATVAIISWVMTKILKYKTSGISTAKPITTPINLPIYLFTFISFLSIFWSAYPEISIKAFIFKWLEYILLFFIVAEVIDEEKKVRNLIFSMALSATIISVDGLVQWFTGTDFLRGYKMVVSPRIQASFKFPAGFSAWLSITTFPFLSAALFYKNSRGLRIFFGVISISLLLCLILSFSKGALIGVFVALLLLIFLKRKNKKQVFFIITLFLIALVIFTFFSPLHIKESFLASSPAIKERIFMWKIGWNMFLNRPFLGQGLNTFMANYVKFSPLGAQITKSGISYAHNCFLQIAAEIGIFGLLSFLWIVTRIIKDSIKAQRIIKDNFLSSIHLGFFCGIIAFLIYSAFETNLYSLRLAVLFWYSLGALMAISRIGVCHAA